MKLIVLPFSREPFRKAMTDIRLSNISLTVITVIAPRHDGNHETCSSRGERQRLHFDPRTQGPRSTMDSTDQLHGTIICHSDERVIITTQREGATPDTLRDLCRRLTGKARHTVVGSDDEILVLMVRRRPVFVSRWMFARLTRSRPQGAPLSSDVMGIHRVGN
jgi:hypothetical protein